MVLESLRSGAPTNVRNLAIENPEAKEPGRPFDPRTDISPEDWISISEYFNHLRDGNRLFMLRNLITLAPWKKSEFINETIPYEEFRGGIFAPRNRESLEFLAWLKVVHPHQAKEKLKNPNKHKKGFISAVEKSALSSNIYDVMDLIDVKICMPQIMDLAEIPQEEKEYIKESLVEVITDYQSRSPSLFAHAVASHNFLFTNDAYEVSESDWKIMKQKLNESRLKKDWTAFIKLAAHMTWIAADVLVDDGGVRFMLPEITEQYNQTTPPLPEARRF